MDTFIYILIGILSAVFTYSVGYSVIGVVRGIKTMKDLENRIFQLELDLGNLHRELHQRIDTEIHNCNSYVDEVQANLDLVEKDIFSQMDSRFDKTENKFRDQIASSVEVLKVIEDNKLLKERLDEFIRTYQNQ
jgi:biopolymer transport protein ExbB/TolQ